MKRRHIGYLFVLLLLSACKPKSEQEVMTETEVKPHPQWERSNFIDPALTDSLLKDKILGMILGSAIGDAMGAPTEMWLRPDIVREYDYIDRVTLVLREPSAEGPWDFNLPPGGTTDDTRWKAILVDFFEKEAVRRGQTPAPRLSAANFAQFLVDRYRAELQRLKDTEGFDPGPYEQNMRRINWLQEWALVAKPFADGDVEAYGYQLSHFYGGEMACAGMLYAPMIGAYYPGRPEVAYEEMYKLGIFDIGYARDISGLTAALVAEAMRAQPQKDSLLRTIINIDPDHFFRSRLIGRAAYRIFKDAETITREAKKATLSQWDEMKLTLPPHFPYDSLYYLQMQEAFRLMDKKNQDIPFHAGEIHLINLTALLFCDLDFAKSIEFVTNYGRDNDTVAAVTGAILGAYWGASRLPAYLKDPVLRTNKQQLGIDLPALAERLEGLVRRR
ncbi:MAG: ADP-ribosylglycohydrolase family protein [Saprospiraceae bacterium]